MRKIRVLVLGGYGGAGSSISHLLLQETDCDIVIAGRHKAKALELCARLNTKFPGRATGVFADASQSDSLKLAMQGVDLIISASTSLDYVEVVAEVALQEDVDYLDIHYPQQRVNVLKRLAEQITAQGRCFVTQAGFNPGLSSVLVRLAKDHFTQYEMARVGVAMNTRFEKGEALNEFLDSLGNYKSDLFREGRWRKASVTDVVTFDFGRTLGKKQCFPMSMEEMWALPEMLGLKELGFFAAGMNWFVDYLIIPAAFVLGKVHKGLGRAILASLMVSALERFSPLQEEVAIIMEAAGYDEAGPKKFRITVRHNDAYFITAAPVVAFVRQYLQEKIPPGLNIMGHAVDPEIMIKDLQRMGVEVELSVS
jgi:saccharopine dehydrogenase (NAD+, L-lysine-forming)